MAPPPSDFSRHIERFTGFAEEYDRHRPRPPAELAELLSVFAGLPSIDSLVDLGSGTGLSTRYWADKARNVVGIEPAADMREKAKARVQADSVSFQAGFSHRTGLPDRFAQIVSCSQALHLMDPQSTFEEVRRILLPGGVFAASDYDWPPTAGAWQADAACAECLGKIHRLGEEFGVSEGITIWDKATHLARMQSSGCFRYVKEVVLHQAEEGDAERLVGVVLSRADAVGLLKKGLSEADLGIDSLREVANRTLGDKPRRWVWSWRVRMGVT